MEYVFAFAAILVTLYFYFGRRRSNLFVRSVTDDVAAILKDDGEPENAIRNFLNSMDFKVIAKLAFGKMREWDAVKMAFEEYRQKSVLWRGSA